MPVTRPQQSDALLPWIFDIWAFSKHEPRASPITIDATGVMSCTRHRPAFAARTSDRHTWKGQELRTTRGVSTWSRAITKPSSKAETSQYSGRFVRVIHFFLQLLCTYLIYGIVLLRRQRSHLYASVNIRHIVSGAPHSWPFCRYWLTWLQYTSLLTLLVDVD